KAELASLRAYHEELAASEGGSQTTFVLVECVKWAGGSPRLYEGTKSAPAGAMLALSDKEALLASSKDIFQGTANPISLRLAGVLGDVAHSQFAMDKFAWVQSVFDLSYLHHGSVLKRPRLPITTHFADRLAYMLSALGKDGGEWESELTAVSEGTDDGCGDGGRAREPFETALGSSKSNEDKEAEMVMASLRRPGKLVVLWLVAAFQADEDGSGDLDHGELRSALGKFRVRDRLKLLQIPYPDLEMLFLLLDEDNKGVIKCDYFFRGVAKLRGLAKAKDLHQLSIDLNRRMLWVDESTSKLSEANDILMDMVDHLDEMDTHIVKGESDGKDPVIAARRGREPVSKGRILRGVWKDGRPMRQGSKNPWIDFEELQKEAKETRKKNASKRRAEAEAKRLAEMKPKKKRNSIDDDQPTPPPLPAHLQILKEDRDRRKNEKFVVKQKKKRIVFGSMPPPVRYKPPLPVRFKVPKGNIVPLAPNEPDIQLGKTLVAAKPHRITADQIELGRRTLRRLMGRKGDFLVNVHATYAVSCLDQASSVTQKPHGTMAASVKMGQGKGNIEYFVARVPAGRVMFKLLVC
ncbi:rplP, partial [Symbiodinium microadriaticum]